MVQLPVRPLRVGNNLLVIFDDLLTAGIVVVVLVVPQTGSRVIIIGVAVNEDLIAVARLKQTPVYMRVKRIGVVQRDVLHVANAVGVQQVAQLPDIVPTTEMRIHAIVVLDPVAVITGSVSYTGSIISDILHHGRDPDCGYAQMLQVIYLLNNSLNVATPITSPLLFLRAVDDKAVDRVSRRRIFRVHVGLIGIVRVEAVGEEKIDRPRTIVGPRLRVTA